ncbi:MAG: OmpH family outer membrane protein [Burkholderiales bacterium]
MLSMPALAQAKIGFVNLDRILREAPAAQRAQKKLEQEFSKRDQDISKMADQLKKMQENLEKNAVTMSESDRQKRERELNDTNREFQRKQREFREELNQRKQEEFAAIIDRANKTIRAIAEAEKFDAVFQDAVYVNPQVDITERVIKSMDENRAAK